MANKTTTNLLASLVTIVLFTGCSKDHTKYYEDDETPGVAIFSNTNNNVLSCFINNRSWRTIARKTSGFPTQLTSYEVDVIKQSGNTANDTLVINWQGHYFDDDFSQGDITLHLVMPQNFNHQIFAALQGQRLRIDAPIGFFTTSIGGLPTSNVKGTGNIYFHTAHIDSTGQGIYNGHLSGIFEADFGNFKITKGRFDHLLTPDQIHF